MSKVILLTIEPVPWLNMMLTFEDVTGKTRTLVLGTPFNNEEKVLRIGKLELRVDGEKHPDKSTSPQNVTRLKPSEVKALLAMLKEADAEIHYGLVDISGQLVKQTTKDWDLLEPAIGIGK